MLTSSTFFKAIFFFLFRFLFRNLITNSKTLNRNFSNVQYNSSQSKYQKFASLPHRPDLANKTIVFNVEGSLLRSSSMFPYFMLVAFEAGSLIRALVLLVVYPFTCLLGGDVALKIMVMVTFFGLRKDRFRAGRAVLPKFFLEDVGLEAFEVLRRGGRRVAVSDFPQVMVESFLVDYLEINCVVGRELKVAGGYFLGVMEEKRKDVSILEKILEEEKMNSRDVIGISRFNRFPDHRFFSHCKEIYLVRRADKSSWQLLPRDRYPKPLIFHDGRLAIRPTPLATLALFMWIPLGLPLSIIRILIAVTLPHDLSVPILISTGLRTTIAQPARKKEEDDDEKAKAAAAEKENPKKGLLYVCNHRTLLDPLYLSFSLKKHFTAVTYSLSRTSEMISPIRTVRLTRDRDLDGRMMETLLSQGDLVVCPEGTTCREPYLLRFSPLFSEMSDEIVPVALDTHVDMFYGTTAGGLKCLDPVFFLMNPIPSYTVRLLESVSGLSTCRGVDDVERRKFEVANQVQGRIGEELGFECTKLTRRHKYLILAGNEGIVGKDNKITTCSSNIN